MDFFGGGGVGVVGEGAKMDYLLAVIKRFLDLYV